MQQDNKLFLKRCELLPFVEMRQASLSTACYHAHSHDEFSFGVIDAGIADYQNRQQGFRIGQGDTVTINPQEVHSCNPLAGQWSYRMLFVDCAWVAQLQQELGVTEPSNYRLFSDCLTRSVTAYLQFDQLFANLLAPSNQLVAETVLIGYLAPYFVSDNQVPLHNDPANLLRVKQLISDQLAINHSLTDLATVSGLSRYHLIRSFKHCYGLSPHAYQLDERIKQAKVLLKSGRSLLDTSHILGFADQSHLQRNFKKRLALTPKQYQNFFV